MKRRDFVKSCSTGLAAAGSSLALGGLVHAQQRERAGRRTPAIDADKMARSAYEHFIPGGLSCCEAMALIGCEALGIESELIPDIALGLAGGIGFQGKTCGCVTGAALVLSLAVAAQESEYPQKKMRTLQATARLYKKFEETFGTTQCRALCGLDLTTPEGRKALMAGVKERKCSPLVQATARMLAKELPNV
ncbi:MAG: C-GCAxxG-C-C family protein [Armatimonadota bacterium]|jgi:C_GCAxxG_C_C family probable redox protein